jgi:3-phosphoshikimate 1-carboxyvinyltransferase
MPLSYRLSCPQQSLSGSISLEPSKSISNRLLIIRSLCDTPFDIQRLSESDDTRALLHMLSAEGNELNSGHAGTAYRFMAARLCLGTKEVVLDGSMQMRKRPIGPLVNALRELGAGIEYTGKEGFPPLRITPQAGFGKELNEIHLKAGVSSQYISALLLIAPVLPKGLVIHLQDDPVSEPYIKMTLALMKVYGVTGEWKENVITIPSQSYISQSYMVEGDWSAASSYYAMAALTSKANIVIEGLSKTSLQGDRKVVDVFQKLGVETEFQEDGIRILKTQRMPMPESWEQDFSKTPDIAQSVMVALAGLGIKGRLNGLQTLRIKETDRLAAMQKELSKVKVTLTIKEGKKDISGTVEGKAKWKDKAKFETYDDHRMAMSLSALGCLHPVIIYNPDVVTKSYPGFWNDVAAIGMKVEKVK